MAASANNFNGLRIAALESRRADDMVRLISKCGGDAYVSPSMCEVPIDPNRPAIDFVYRVITGEISIMILMTGVGLRYLIQATERHVDTKRFLEALSDIVTICRGPKPVVVMREFGLKPTHRVPEPNTWRDVLQLIDRDVPVANQVVGVQEYGVANASLIAGLEARGAIADCVRVYGWEFPKDVGPLRDNILAISRGERDVLLVTSAHQVVNMLRLSEEMNLATSLRQGLSNTVIASIGPTTSEMLRECDLHVDMEPSHPKMGHLVTETAACAAALVQEKKRRRGRAAFAVAATSDTTSRPSSVNALPYHDSLFMRACRGEPTPRTPVWLMRQAGRYMSEYRSVRAKTTFMQLCENPQLCSEVMCTAVAKLNVDAAIIFSDLLPLLVPLGFDLEYTAGDGPVIHNPVRTAADLDRVSGLMDPGQLGFVYETVRQTRKDLPDSIPLIGFAGSPFTLASYAIEGGSSRQYTHTKSLMRSDCGGWSDLMDRLTDAVIQYLNLQIEAGAQCVQLFDSWAGCLSPGDYRTYVLPWMTQIIRGVAPGVPLINFATGNPELLPLLRGDQRTVVGIDWRIDLADAWKQVGHDVSVQGNLDPTVLLTDVPTLRHAVKESLESVRNRPGHIFNLGHGILKETPVDHAVELVNAVKEFSAGWGGSAVEADLG